MTNKAKIAFNVHGWIEQEIELTPGFSAAAVTDMLANGNAFTTVHKDGNLIVRIHADGIVHVLGTVIHNNNQLEYFNFNLQDTWEES